jgi:hypothetical protein
VTDTQRRVEVVDVELAQASLALATGRQRAAETAAALSALRARVAAGDSTVTASDLATAEHEEAHAALAAEGAQPELRRLTEERQRIEVEAVCDEVVATVPGMRARIGQALRDVRDALAELEQAGEAHRGYTREVGQRLARFGGLHGTTSPRVRTGGGAGGVTGVVGPAGVVPLQPILAAHAARLIADETIDRMQAVDPLHYRVGSLHPRDLAALMSMGEDKP